MRLVRHVITSYSIHYTKLYEPLSATGYIMATAVYIFGFKKYHPLVRLGVLTGFMGYLFAVISYNFV